MTQEQEYIAGEGHTSMDNKIHQDNGTWLALKDQ
jgi:hypothetical protein